MCAGFVSLFLRRFFEMPTTQAQNKSTARWILCHARWTVLNTQVTCSVDHVQLLFAASCLIWTKNQKKHNVSSFYLDIFWKPCAKRQFFFDSCCHIGPHPTEPYGPTFLTKRHPTVDVHGHLRSSRIRSRFQAKPRAFYKMNDIKFWSTKLSLEKSELCAFFRY